MMEARKDYETVYWGKMPVNFRPQAFRRSEVEEAVRRAERDFPEVSDLVPDFSVLTLGAGPGGDIEAALVLGDEREAMALRRGGQEYWSLDGLLWEVALRIRAAQAGDEAQARPDRVSARRPLGAPARRIGAVRPSGTIPRATPLSHVTTGAAL